MPMQSPGLYIRTILPPELLSEIFRLATDNPVRDVDGLVVWTPFEGMYAAENREKCSSALRTKCALALACRLFRSLSVEFLYEDIWVRHGSDGLAEALEASKLSDRSGLGRFAKRISLSPIGFDGSGQSCSSILRNARRILSCCLNVRVIRRPPQVSSKGQDQNDTNEFVDSIPRIDDFKFPLLHRVEWHNTPNDTIPAAAPTPSIFFFSRSLRVLILGPDNFPDHRDGGDDPPQITIINLPKLHTLSIQSLDSFGDPRRRYSLTLPSLRHLILKRPEAIFTLFDGALTPFSSQITSIELASDFRFLRQDFLSSILTYCQNVEEVYIPVFSTRAPHQNEVPRAFREFPALRYVYLHAGLPNGYVYGEQAWWTMLDAHFEGLCGQNSRFVELGSIVLVGREWMQSVKDVRFKSILEVVVRKGVVLVADDVDVRRMLASVILSEDGGTLVA